MIRKYKPYLLVLPQVLLAAIFLISLITGITQSFGVVPAFGLTEPTFKYYIEIFQNKDMLTSILFSLYIAFTSAFFSTVIGVLICMFLVQGNYNKGLALRAIQIPIVVPHVVVAIFTINILSQSGLLARIFCALGFIEEMTDFWSPVFEAHGLGIILAYLWKEIPFIIFFIISLMSNIDGRLGEAAINLGASKWTSFTKVTLPLCLKPIASGFLIIFTFTFGAYELPQLLGATLPKALPILSYLEYTHPDLRHRPYSMALNGVIIVISFACALVYFKLMTEDMDAIRKKDGDHNA